MIVWTSQPNTVYEQVQQNGLFICDPEQSEFIDLPDFVAAYSWMCEKMTQRIGPAPDGVKFPIWAWYRRHGKNKRPDLREMNFRGEKEPMVLMELEIPDEEVLLSDEMMWHEVILEIQDGEGLTLSRVNVRIGTENSADIDFDGEMALQNGSLSQLKRWITVGR